MQFQVVFENIRIFFVRDILFYLFVFRSSLVSAQIQLLLFWIIELRIPVRHSFVVDSVFQIAAVECAPLLRLSIMVGIW